MVRSFAVRMAALALVAALAAALPLNARAEKTTASDGATQYHYSTTVTPVYGSKYPIAGHLDLEIFPSGILRGYYHNAYVKQFIPVTGGRDGNYIWFDIGPTLSDLGFDLGPTDRLHVVATMDSDNSFRGQLYPENMALATSAAPPLSGNGAQGSPTSRRGQLNPQNSVASAAPGFSNTSDQANGQPDQLIFAAKPIEKSPEDYQGTY